MSPAAASELPRKDRLERFRELRARLDPSGDPADAMTALYVERPDAVGSRIAAELELSPASSHLLVGGVGSGKTTELLAIRNVLTAQTGDVHATYIDVSKQQDIARMGPGAIVAQVGLALAASLPQVHEALVRPFITELRRLAHGFWADNEGGGGFRVPGVLVSPLAEPVQETLKPLDGLLEVLRAKTRHVVVLLDGLDRMTDMPAFEQLVVHDVRALKSVDVGVVLVGPLRALYGLDRTIVQRFDSFHYQPWIDLAEDFFDGHAFVFNVLRRRVAEAFDQQAFEVLVPRSGGVLRDLLTLAQSACLETYMNGGERVGEREVWAAVDTFGRKHLQGLRSHELAVLQSVRTQGTFTQTSEDDLALLMTRRILEYRRQGNARYVVHPTIEKLLEEISRR